MGILRVNTVSGIETTTPVTGSVSFTGVAGTHLSISTSTDFSFQNADFTIEFWMNTSDNTRTDGTFSQTPFAINGDQCRVYLDSSNGKLAFKYRGTDKGTSFTAPENQWTHIALVRQNSVIKFFKDGVPDNTNTLTDSTGNTNGILTIGAVNNSGQGAFLGFISNLRIRRGTAGYTTNFTPPIYELEPIQDTVLLCCQSGVSTTSLSFAGIGSTVSEPRVITANGSVSASSTSPGLVRNYTFGTQFGGVSKFDTFGYFVPPSGTTEQRFPNFPGVSAASARGVFAGGSPATNTIDFITISTLGNAQDFGDLLGTKGQGGGLSSATRGLYAGGENPAAVNNIDYITIASTGNAADFGDLIQAKRRFQNAGFSNSTRGLWSGGYNPSLTPSTVNTIEFVTIASTGNAQDFGDLLQITESLACCASTTRGIIAGGRSQPANVPFNVIQYITISSTGNALDFGDLALISGAVSARHALSSCSNSIRGLFGGGNSPSLPTARINNIDYITIASIGNAIDFGDLLTPTEFNTSCSSSTRGIFGGGNVPTVQNVIEHVTILSTGNSIDFGDLTVARQEFSAFSNGHGGLG